ncbi:MAG: ChbG/HpnK family deacetylase [Syntrophus sp. (in: bacteria)]
MKYLIVNADDFGADVCRNQGIAEAVAVGVVTSVSVLVNGPAFDDALARLPAWQGRGVSVGLHVNLSEGYPVCKGLAVLPDEHGCFRGKSSTHKLLMQKGNQELEREIAREIEAQIGLLESKGIKIIHLDGHQHVHVFPMVIGAAIRAARRHGITWLRIPEEMATVAITSDNYSCPNHLPDHGEANHDQTEILRREAYIFSRLAAAARPLLKGSDIRTTDHFRGLYLKGRLSFPRLEMLLNDLPVGITELMAHPGRAPAGPGQGPFSAFSNMNREEELDVLLDPRLLKTLKEKGVFLTPYPEIQL